jgi:transcription antitermination factor NusG
LTLVPLPEPQWYAVMVRPRQEVRAAGRLSGMGYQTFVPIERVRTLRRVPGQQRKVVRIVDRPLMSRYIFVGLYYRSQGLYHVTNCDLVSCVVTFDGAPVRVPNPVIDALMAADGERAKLGVLDEVKRKPFRSGQAVRLRAGHMFADFIAEIEVIEDQGNKVRAWAEMFRSRREVEFKPSDLEVA